MIHLPPRFVLRFDLLPRLLPRLLLRALLIAAATLWSCGWPAAIISLMFSDFTLFEDPLRSGTYGFQFPSLSGAPSTPESPQGPASKSPSRSLVFQAQLPPTSPLSPTMYSDGSWKALRPFRPPLPGGQARSARSAGRIEPRLVVDIS